MEPMAHTLHIRADLWSLERPKVMGILNLTDDSFHAPSRIADTDSALRRVEQMLGEGMDILDVGAVSTRPGAQLPDEPEERRRLQSTLQAIVARFPQLPVSVDTFRASIARMAADCGAHIINDVSGGAYDPAMFATMGQLQLPYVLMHMQGTPQDMQNAPHYEDVLADLLSYFADKLQQARAAGIHDVILDPGFGFGKTMEHNYRLLAHLHDFAMFDVPILVGMSRKSMLYKLLDCTPEEALNATTAAHMLALQNGADILRVHDVKEAVQCVKIFCQCRQQAKNNVESSQAIK